MKAQRGSETCPRSHSSCASGGTRTAMSASVWFQRPFSFSPSAALPSSGWSSTSGSQMTPTPGGKAKTDWGPCLREAGGGVGSGAGWPSAFRSEALPGEAGCWSCPPLSSQLLLEDNVLLIRRRVLQTAGLIVKVSGCECASRILCESEINQVPPPFRGDSQHTGDSCALSPHPVPAQRWRSRLPESP